jgi:hypothetical protein
MKYAIRYSAFITIEVDAMSEDSAMQVADLIVSDMTGADFRENLDWDGISELKEDLNKEFFNRITNNLLGEHNA